MARTNTTNLNLVQPDRLDQYDVDDFNSNMEKIDNFAGLTPPRALTADKLTVGKNINGVLFDGSKSVITGLGLHSITETYAMNNIAYTVEDGKVKLHKSKQNQNQGHATSEVDWWEEVSLGGGMPVGSIFAHSASASFVPENSVPCDGTEYRAGQFNALWNDFLILKRLETCTYEEYQQEVTTNGACAKFGIDTVKRTFKVPTIPDGYYVKSGQGTANKAGLPNITGSYRARATNDRYPIGYCKGAFKNPSKDNSGTVSATSTPVNTPSGFIFDASLSSPIYGKSDTVETNAVAYRYFVVVATGSIKQSEMDWSRYMDGLNGKLNTDVQSNITKEGKIYISGLGMPSEKFVDLSLGVSGTQYTAPANGWVFFQLAPASTSGSNFITLINITKALAINDRGFNDGNFMRVYIPVAKNDEFHIGYYNGNVNFKGNTLKFIYAEGSKE